MQIVQCSHSRSFFIESLARAGGGNYFISFQPHTKIDFVSSVMLMDISSLCYNISRKINSCDLHNLHVLPARFLFLPTTLSLLQAMTSMAGVCERYHRITINVALNPNNFTGDYFTGMA